MPKKKAFALRVSPEMMAAVEKWAADEFRSTNGQIEWIIDQALQKAGRKKKAKEGKKDPEAESSK
ncbi:MAG: Arc family DNA binding domain-containing protein [Bacteroidota bacterium]